MDLMFHLKHFFFIISMKIFRINDKLNNFFFYVPWPSRIWVIMDLQNFPFFVALSSICLVTITPSPCIYTRLLGRLFSVFLYSSCFQYVRSGSNSSSAHPSYNYLFLILIENILYRFHCFNKIFLFLKWMILFF